jgi:hypothetical protein
MRINSGITENEYVAAVAYTVVRSNPMAAFPFTRYENPTYPISMNASPIFIPMSSNTIKTARAIIPTVTGSITSP